MCLTLILFSWIIMYAYIREYIRKCLRYPKAGDTLHRVLGLIRLDFFLHVSVLYCWFKFSQMIKSIEKCDLPCESRLPNNIAKKPVYVRDTFLFIINSLHFKSSILRRIRHRWAKNSSSDNPSRYPLFFFCRDM